MVSADREFAEFIETRGSALWAMASLLEIDELDARRTLTDALAGTRRRWPSIRRDGDAESLARDLLGASFVARHRRAGTLEVAASPPVEQASSQRVALSQLTARQRALLVLPAYVGATVTEAARLLDMTGAEAKAMVDDAERTFREHAGAASNAALITLLDAAALRDAPPDLLADSLRAWRPRHTALIAAAVVVVAAVAVVIAVTPWRGGTEATGAESAVNSWGIPNDLHLFGDIPSLAASPIDRASTALVVGGTPLVADAVTGQTRAVFGTQWGPAWFDREDDKQTMLIRSRWTQTVLSPDGAWLLLVKVDRRPVTGRHNQPGADVGQLFLVKVATGATSRIDEMNPSADATGTAGIAESRLVWAPDSKSFACACSGTLSIGELNSDEKVTVTHTTVRARAVAWGSPGLAVAEPHGGWWYVDRPTVASEALVYSAALAISFSDPESYLEVSALTIYALGADRKPDGGHCTLWDADFSYPVSILPAAERGGTLCTPVALQAGRDGFLLVLPAKGSQTAQPLDIVVVHDDGTSSDAGSFPPGTTAASFATDLVG
jgi:hypothetical protein